MVIIDPYVPDGQDVREVERLEPSAGAKNPAAWRFACNSSLGWNGPRTDQVLMAPRGAEHWEPREDGSLIADGCLVFVDSAAEYRGFTAQLYPTAD